MSSASHFDAAESWLMRAQDAVHQGVYDEGAACAAIAAVHQSLAAMTKANPDLTRTVPLGEHELADTIRTQQAFERDFR